MSTSRSTYLCSVFSSIQGTTWHRLQCCWKVVAMHYGSILIWWLHQRNLPPFPKKTILSEWNIWKLLSLLIDIWDKWKRGNSSQGVKRNFNMLVEGCISNIWDELNVVITVRWSRNDLVWDNPTGPNQTPFRSDCWSPLQTELKYLWRVLSCSQDDIRCI